VKIHGVQVSTPLGVVVIHACISELARVTRRRSLFVIAAWALAVE